MKKFLLGLFGFISLGLINFSSAYQVNAGNNAIFYEVSYLGTSNSFTNTISDFDSIGNTDYICFKTLGELHIGSASNVYCQYSSLDKMGFSCIPKNALVSYCGLSSSTTITSTAQTSIFVVKGNCSSIESDLSTCQSNLATATGSLSTCQNNLATATGSLSTCQSSLSSCQSDLSSCQNSSSSCSPTGSCTVNDKVSENILFSGSKNFSTSYTNMFNYGDQGAGTYCLKFTSSNPQTLTMGFANGSSTTPTNLYSLYNDQYGNWICLYGNKPYLNVKLNASSNTINYEVYKLTDLLSDDVPCSTSSCPDCPSCPSLSGYILESDITQDYCEVRYDLITPEDCPVYTGSEFTGEVMWSSFWVNERQIMGGRNIYLYLPDFLNWDYTYVDQNLQIDVENEGDEEYIQSVIDINSYRPTSSDFTDTFVSGLTLVMPYIVIVLFIVFVWKLLKKIFK